MSDQTERDAEVKAVSSEAGRENGEIIDAEVTEVGADDDGAERPAGGGSLKLALVLAIVAVIGVTALVGFGYRYWSNLQASLVEMNQSIAEAEQARGKLQQRLDETRKAYEEQNQVITEQKSILTAQDEKLTQERDRLQQQSREMSDSLDAVFDRVGRESTAWMAAEAEYLMGVANHRLRLEKDVSTAIKALQAADGRLRDTGDPGWSEVRQSLAEEIAALQAVGQLDRTGLSAKLVAMAAQVNNLKIVGTEPAPRAEPAAEGETDAESRSLKTLVKDGWEGFKSVMVIRHHGKPVTAMLPPEQQFFVYQNLRLQLEAARMSMLRGDQILYKASLEMAEQWIQDLFDTEDGAAQAVLGEVAELKTIDISPGLPDISASLMALRSRMKSGGGDGQ